MMRHHPTLFHHSNNAASHRVTAVLHTWAKLVAVATEHKQTVNGVYVSYTCKVPCVIILLYSVTSSTPVPRLCLSLPFLGYVYRKCV